jgi:hypothetical protein
LSRDSSLFISFRDIFRQKRSEGGQVDWAYDDLRNIFASLLSSWKARRLYILLDAMDESDKQGRPEILQLLMQLCSTPSASVLKALIATRPLPRHRPSREEPKRYRKSNCVRSIFYRTPSWLSRNRH